MGETKEHRQWWKRTRGNEQNYWQKERTKEGDSDTYMTGKQSDTHTEDQEENQRRKGIKATNEEEKYEDILHLLVKHS